MKKRIIALLITAVISSNGGTAIICGYHAGMAEIEQVSKTKGMYTYEVNMYNEDKGIVLKTKKHYKESVDYIVVYKKDRVVKIVKY